jgi:tetratricopeptide (TPR) repeat protein
MLLYIILVFESYLIMSSQCKKQTDTNCCANCDASHDPHHSVHHCILSKCSRCKIVSYCSKECQIQDWKRHKPNCIRPEKRHPNIQQKPDIIPQGFKICTICQEPLKNNRSILPTCLHEFHYECLCRWLQIKESCPLCNSKCTKFEEQTIEYIRIMRNKDIKEIDIFIKKLELCEKSSSTLNMLSDLYKLKGQANKAEKILKITNTNFPNNIPTLSNLAIFYMQTNQRYLARKYYDKCYSLLDKLDKTHVLAESVLLNYAAFLTQSPEVPKISKDLGGIIKAKTAEKKLKMIEYSLDCANVTIEDQQLARILINTVLEKNPKCYKAYFLLARLTTDIKEQLDFYMEAIKYDNNPLVNYRIAVRLVELNYLDEATTYYEIALGLDRSLTDERISFYFALMSLERLEEGKQILREILIDVPTCVKAQDLLKLIDQFNL